MGRRFLPILIGLASVCAAPAFAQDTTPSDAERIARMRDQAAQPSADAPVTTGTDETAEQPVEQPAPPLPANELLPLGVGEGEAGLFNSETGARPGSSSLGGNWLLSTLAALGVVIALVFVVRWLLRRGGVVSSAAPQGSVVEVLSRTTVAPRSHVVLMRVGQRVLVVSDSPAGMRTLDTVTDPGEIAELLGAVEMSRETSISKSFNGVMKRLSGQWSDDEQAYDADAELPVDEEGVGMTRARGAVSSVRGRLAALSGAGGKA